MINFRFTVKQQIVSSPSCLLVDCLRREGRLWVGETEICVYESSDKVIDSYLPQEFVQRRLSFVFPFGDLFYAAFLSTSGLS